MTRNNIDGFDVIYKNFTIQVSTSNHLYVGVIQFVRFVLVQFHSVSCQLFYHIGMSIFDCLVLWRCFMVDRTLYSIGQGLSKMTMQHCAFQSWLCCCLKSSDTLIITSTIYSKSFEGKLHGCKVNFCSLEKFYSYPCHVSIVTLV